MKKVIAIIVFGLLLSGCATTTTTELETPSVGEYEPQPYRVIYGYYVSDSVYEPEVKVYKGSSLSRENAIEEALSLCRADNIWVDRCLLHSIGKKSIGFEFFWKKSVAKYKSSAKKVAEKPKKKKPKKKKSEPKKKLKPDEIYSVASGTGFFINSSGNIVSNNHVIDACNTVKVHYNGVATPVTILAIDRANDLSLMISKVRPKDYFSVSAGDASLLDDIYVAGYPFGKMVSSSVKVTKGVVSALTGLGDNYSNIQIDAALQL